MTKPTKGRIVWYREAIPSILNEEVPAIIVRVFENAPSSVEPRGSTRINLTVFTDHGPIPAFNVPYDEDLNSGADKAWRWPPRE